MLELIERYDEVRNKVIHSNLDEAAHIVSQFRSQEDESLGILQHQLLSARLAMKAGSTPSTIKNVIVRPAWPDYFKGEVHMMKGFFYFYQNKFHKGSKQFSLAAEYFNLTTFKSRALNCKFNEIYGRIDHLNMPVEQILSELTSLQKEAFEYGDQNVLGLIHRRKSASYMQIGKNYAALGEALSSIELLEIFGSRADFQCALIQGSYIYFLLKKHEKALELFEKIIPPMDHRLKFSYHFVHHKLTGSEFDPSAYEVVSSYWRSQVESHPVERADEMTWRTQDSELLVASGETISVKKKSLEGMLLSLLSQTSMKKETLIEQLWPEHGEKENIENRLHKLVSRFNKKTNQLVGFDCQAYFLRRPLKVV